VLEQEQEQERALGLEREQGQALGLGQALELGLHRQVAHLSAPPKQTKSVFVFYSFFSSS